MRLFWKHPCPVVFFFFLGLAFLVYWPSLHGEWYMDDYPAIVNNAKIKNIPSAMAYLHTRKRPITYASFAVNYALHGLEPVGYHLVNVLLHTGVAFLTFSFLWATYRMTGRGALTDQAAYWMAFGVALLFLVHPAVTQAVSYVYQRSTLLAAFFSLGSVHAFLLSRTAEKRRTAWLMAAVAAMLLAIGSKENAAMLPILLLLYAVVILPRSVSTRTLWIIGLLLCAFLLSFPFLVEGSGYVDYELKHYEARTFTPVERLLTQSRVIVFYGTLMAWPSPWRLNLDHDFPLSLSFFVPVSTAFSLGLLLGLVLVAFYLRRRAPMAAFGILWFLSTLLIESSIVPLEMVFEHRLYFPALGLLIICAEGARWVGRKFTSPRLSRYASKGMAIALFCIVCCALGFATVQRNRIWREERRLWEDAVKKSPHKTRPIVALANTYREASEYTRSMALLQHSVDHLPQAARAFYTMGLISLQQGDEEKAEQLYRVALRTTPRLAEPFNDLGIIAFRRGDGVLAETFFLRAIDREPAYAKAWANLGIVYEQRRDWERAFSYSKKALELNPEVEGHERIRRRMLMLRDRMRIQPTQPSP